MIRQPGPTPKRPPSARTPGGPTPARTAGWMPGSTGVNSTTQPLRSCTTPDAPPRARRWRSPRRRGRGVESDQVAAERGRLDAVIAGLLFMAGMRRSEVSALRWADVANATDGDGMLVTVRRSKTNQEGEVNDVRFVKDGVARALRTLRAATSPEPADRERPLSPQWWGYGCDGQRRRGQFGDPRGNTPPSSSVFTSSCRCSIADTPTTHGWPLWPPARSP